MDRCTLLQATQPILPLSREYPVVGPKKKIKTVDLIWSSLSEYPEPDEL